MIMASCASSKSPATISARPSARMAIWAFSPAPLSARPISRANRMPTAVAPSQMPSDLKAIQPMWPQSTAPLPPDAPITPMPMARTTMPSTSSITAPATMVTPSGESSLRFSERMRAVMLTEVAVDMTPRKMQAGSRKLKWRPPMMPGSSHMPSSAPTPYEAITPPSPTRPPANA